MLPRAVLMPSCISTPILCIVSNAFWLARGLRSHSGTLYRSVNQQQRFNHSTPPHSNVLDAIHRTNLVLPKILPSEALSAWKKLLYASGDTVSGIAIRRRRIAVLGLDDLCRPHELTSALLDDPLVSDSNIIHALRDRRAQSPSDLMIISHADPGNTNAHLSLHLPWLKRLDVDITEIPLGHPDAIPLLYDADVQIMVASPLASPLAPEFQSLLLKTGSFLVVEYPTFDQVVVNRTVSQLTRHFPTISDTLKSRILQAYPYKALSALDLFREGANSINAVQSFQNDFLGSGVAKLSQSITKYLSSDWESQRAQRTRFVLTGALEACHNATDMRSRDALKVQHFIDELRSQISDARVSGIQETLGGNDAPDVGDSIQRSTKEMQALMDAISWWKLPLKIDDLSEVLFHTAERVWCRDLHAKLEFHTGRLACLRSKLTSSTLERLRLLPAEYHSAVLVNQLRQLAARPPEMGPNTLTYPLSYRLQQLQQPIYKLHRQAQRAMLTVSMTTLGSVGGAYAAWITDWISPATAIGLSALGFVTGLRWFVGRWERGKARWWEDWHRVGSGLQRDLKELLALVVKEKVTSVPSKAVEELENMLAQQSRKMAELNEELENIERSVAQVEQDDSPVN